MTATRTDTPGGTPAVGIDLGTTNSALAWAAPGGPLRVLEVPQLVAPGEFGAYGVLPSFVYLPTDAERAGGLYGQPWAPEAQAREVVGVFARDHGALSPGRQVASAKSWLVNASVDRTAAILPWGGEAERRLSPVEASAAILTHLVHAWNHERARAGTWPALETIAVVLTVPASFDEEARELTVDAARQAGLTDLRLLEEPLAAVYAWIAANRRAAREHLRDGDLLLVCDVGGGTTDFTLVRTRIAEGEPQFERIAIGEHLLLGGDNLDLALAVLAERKLAEGGAPPLSLSQRQTLRRKCSGAKERLLGQEGPERERITLLGAGRGVIAGGATVELSRDDVIAAITDGFLPITAPDDLPARDRRVGLRELGLPYESEPAITRHLAAFLTRAAATAGASGLLAPEVVLFNGGFFAPAVARARVLDALERWSGARPRVLENARPEAAVALGAAFYGRLRQAPEAARRLLIKAGSARAYYIGIHAEAPSEAATAVCVMPRGAQEGTTIALERNFTVVSNKPAAFTLYSATDRAGPVNAVVTFHPVDDVRRHAPLVTAFRFGKRSRSVTVPVRLRASFTETGTLELWCESQTTEHRWRLAFNLRGEELDALDDSSTPGETEARGDEVVVDDAALARAIEMVKGVFSQPSTALRPEALTPELEAVLGHGKHAWPLPAIRALADALLAVEAGRRAGPDREARWLNLVGFCARPGFGTPLDAWRVSELRQVYAAGLAFPRDVQCQVEWLVLWQRVAPGFSTGQQRELAQRIMGQLGVGQKKPPRTNPQIERESWRLLASLERLDAATRERLGDHVLDTLRREPRNTSMAWAAGRLGARTPFHGPLSSVVPPARAERWLSRLLALRTLTPEIAAAIVQVGALTGDPARDLPPPARQDAVARLREAGHPEEAIAPLLSVRPADRADAVRAFGESLPEGLRLEPASVG